MSDNEKQQKKSRFKFWKKNHFTEEEQASDDHIEPVEEAAAESSEQNKKETTAEPVKEKTEPEKTEPEAEEAEPETEEAEPEAEETEPEAEETEPEAEETEPEAEEAEPETEEAEPEAEKEESVQEETQEAEETKPVEAVKTDQAPEQEKTSENEKSIEKVQAVQQTVQGQDATQEDLSGQEEVVISKRDKIIGICMGVVVFLAFLTFYIGMGVYFSEHFYGNTTISEIDCSYMTKDQAKQALQKKLDNYQLDFNTREGDQYSVFADQIDVRYVDDAEVDDILNAQEPMEWIINFFRGGSHEIYLHYQYNAEKLEKLVSELPFAQEDFYTKPADAYVDHGDAGFNVVPEVEGNQPDMEKLQEKAKEAVENGISKIVLDENDCYLTPLVRKEDPQLNGEAVSLNELTAASLTFQILDEPLVLDSNTLKDWVITDENGNYILDPAKISGFVDHIADIRNTYGGSREFTKNNGEVITLTQNYYGWEVDKEELLAELKTALAEGRQGEMEIPYSRVAQGTGTNDLGSVYVEISIDEQRMWCYKDGKVVVDTPVVTGNLSIPGRATPRGGCWPIYKKRTEYTMTGPRNAAGIPEYTAFCHYWLPFNGGVGIHDLASRTSFGGNIYKTRGSHGCINTPLNEVAVIYNTVSVGTPVIVY